MSNNHLGAYVIRDGTEADAHSVVGLRRHAEAWLADAGIEQWTVSRTGTKDIVKRVGNGTTFVVEDGTGEIVASLALDEGDPTFWTPLELTQSAIYLYKFIVHSEHRGIGLGECLLNWALTRSHQLGYERLRLDCWRTNYKLHRYYIERGFIYLGTRVDPHRMSGALFEHPTSVPVAMGRLVDLTDKTGGVGGGG